MEKYNRNDVMALNEGCHINGTIQLEKNHPKTKTKSS